MSLLFLHAGERGHRARYPPSCSRLRNTGVMTMLWPTAGLAKRAFASAMPTALATPWPSGPVVWFRSLGAMAGGLGAELAKPDLLDRQRWPVDVAPNTAAWMRGRSTARSGRGPASSDCPIELTSAPQYWRYRPSPCRHGPELAFDSIHYRHEWRWQAPRSEWA